MLVIIFKALPFIIAGYLVYRYLDKFLARQKIIKGTLISKFIEKDSVAQAHLNANIAYFKEVEKYFFTIQMGEEVTTELVNKDTYGKINVGEAVNMVKYHTRFSRKLLKIVVKA